jgi:hypothetical protein
MMAGRPSLAALLALGILVLAPTAWPHGEADWIRENRFRSPSSGVFCCGSTDCHRLPKAAVKITAAGYTVSFGGRATTIPFGMALPSDDDDFWACWPDGGDVRCFFAPPLGA